jgi:hypothetical protein
LSQTAAASENNISTTDISSTDISISELKELFASHLRATDQLKKPEGLPTGLGALDRFLFWGGIPKSALSLFRGRLGTGATSLWMETAARVIEQNRWVAWVNNDAPLSPLSLHHKKVDLSRLITIEEPANEKKLLWLLQELMASSLFELIGCDLGKFKLREHQLRKLQNLARQSHVALVFLNREKTFTGAAASVFSLIVSCEQKRLLIERALYRPTPHSFARSLNYARFTIHTGDCIGLGEGSIPRAQITNGSALAEPDSLPAAPRKRKTNTAD